MWVAPVMASSSHLPLQIDVQHVFILCLFLRLHLEPVVPIRVIKFHLWCSYQDVVVVVILSAARRVFFIAVVLSAVWDDDHLLLGIRVDVLLKPDGLVSLIHTSLLGQDGFHLLLRAGLADVVALQWQLRLYDGLILCVVPRVSGWLINRQCDLLARAAGPNADFVFIVLEGIIGVLNALLWTT